MEHKDQLFVQHRTELLNIAYGMLGDLSDARDIVQDAYLKWNRVNSGKVDHPAGYLKTIVSRLCIDRFRSAKERREQYVGPWLPQPIPDESGKRPDAGIELHDRLTIALLHLLENLTPDQRAIYLLHDVFDYKFSEISELLDKSPAACRKAAQRARERIHSATTPEMSYRQQSEQTVVDFIEALRERDMERVRKMLTDDAVIYSDGGGKAVAARKPIVTAEKVARFLTGLAEKYAGRITIERTQVNNRPGFRAFRDGELQSIWAFEVLDGRIRKIFAVLNPDKLE